MKRCPCGYYGEPRCTCTPGEIQRYAARVSGPLLDRIDIHVEMPGVPYRELQRIEAGEGSDVVRERVVRARAVQAERFAGAPGLFTNARMGPKEIRRYCALDADGKALLGKAMEKLGLSARAHDRILRVSRTIADLAGTGCIQTTHLAEAIQYRSLDRPRWREGG